MGCGRLCRAAQLPSSATESIARSAAPSRRRELSARQSAAPRSSAVALLVSQVAEQLGGAARPPAAARPGRARAAARRGRRRARPSPEPASGCRTAGSSICWRSREGAEAGADADVHLAHLVEVARTASATSATSSAAMRSSALATRRASGGGTPAAIRRSPAATRRPPARAARAAPRTAGMKRPERLLQRLGQAPRAQEPRRGACGEPALLDQHLRLHGVGHLVVERLDLLPDGDVAEHLACRQVGAHHLRRPRAGALRRGDARRSNRRG